MTFTKRSTSGTRPEPFAPLADERGAGLMVAVFVIVILGLFGTLIARYASLGSTASMEEYLWAQALYSAESAAQLRILTHDRGGTGPTFPMTIQTFTVPDPGDAAPPRGTPATLKTQASRLNVAREVELGYML